ncbi:chromosomal replication initiator DnaA [Palleronia sediminis]|uniref:Chromosomal replication initiator DnaA n=1 Tax=Palleronia sediminis TaxID=2547833 RepID=A0A4R6ADV4_9RHOB|nr:chromosomal replication initiator DnaA [Palleronia sediminis]TDL81305.1 chromosomal replication initiator DnaA [Palleronia sediminis]
MSARQLLFDLPVRRALGREDFVVTESNARAVELLGAEMTWRSGKAVLSGPEASGKTHLAHVWAEETGAVIVPAADLVRLDVPTLARAGRIVIEDVPAVGGVRRAEAALFHLHNLSLPEGGRLLFTGREAPARWPIALPDLSSRLRAAPLLRLDPPDDALLGALLAKHFADRSIRASPRVGDYLVARMVRSAEAAAWIVAELDRLALERGKKITVPLAREALARYDEREGRAGGAAGGSGGRA